MICYLNNVSPIPNLRFKVTPYPGLHAPSAYHCQVAQPQLPLSYRSSLPTWMNVIHLLQPPPYSWTKDDWVPARSIRHISRKGIPRYPISRLAAQDHCALYNVDKSMHTDFQRHSRPRRLTNLGFGLGMFLTVVRRRGERGR